MKIYFLKGNDPRHLDCNQQIEIAQMIEQNCLEYSSYVYNSSETKRKYQSWVNTFPWIKPYYAVKANRYETLIQDLINEGSNFDCASRSEM